MDKKDEKQICSICGEEYEGWGNNAYPINNGRCCDCCNNNLVIPARFTGIKNEEEAYAWVLKHMARALKVESD